jgi:hypothetical protein
LIADYARILGWLGTRSQRRFSSQISRRAF